MKKIFTPFFRYSFSYFYFCSKITFGLLLHPYQTLFATLRERFCRFLLFSPTFIFLVLTFLWRLFFRPLILHFFTATCFLMIIKTSILFFCFFWQITLLYLFFKFILVFSTKKG